MARCSGILHIDVADHRANVGPMSNANVGPTFAIDIGPTLVRRNDSCWDGDGPQNDRILIVTKDTSSDSLGAVSVHSLIDWCERSPIHDGHGDGGCVMLIWVLKGHKHCRNMNLY